ncbi:hypothetical protein CERSUDRAFT_98370 [Gelatoporia subvermispora B]|uniref:Uncharacterized protein n=1 Tax=Ceriporiopsis subvermispora (strain B) TaxID=914234 RepID=M2PDF7_CERS8|nr:hypothetical protein CERSUDRAFT_98370 [Gelatoporia subvermispora B]
MFGLSRMKYKVGDEVNISSDDGAPDVVGVIANVRKTDQGVMYEVSVADGALDIQGGTILEIPEERASERSRVS